MKLKKIILLKGIVFMFMNDCMFEIYACPWLGNNGCIIYVALESSKVWFRKIEFSVKSPSDSKNPFYRLL